MKTKSLFIFAIIFLAANFVLAQDVEPPAWRTNGLPGLTFQAWEFLSDATPSPPNLVSNEFGAPTGEIMLGAFTNNLPNPEAGGEPVSGWYFQYSDNGIVLIIPNDPTDRPSKLIRVQITSTKAPQGINIQTMPPEASVSNTYNQAWQHGGTPWYTYVSDYLVEPNPNEETIVINFPEETIVEEVVVDTWCLPEPVLIVNFYFLFFIYYLKKRK